jgi:hypothetical protein
MPFALGEIVRIFEGGSDRSIWPVLFLYVTLRFLQGSGGLAALRDVGSEAVLQRCDTERFQCLWTPVMQYSDRGNPPLILWSSESKHSPEMSQLAFDHLLLLFV